MQTITEVLLDIIATWPYGVAIVTRTLSRDGTLPQINAQVCLHMRATETTAETTVIFYIVATINGYEEKYSLSVFPGIGDRCSCFDAKVAHLRRRSPAIGISVSRSLIGDDAIMVTRFLHPFILRFINEDTGCVGPDEHFYFDDATVETVNDISGFRFGVMVTELKRLLK